ncbi:hypothetical protein ACTHAL_000219 [Priestia flexa]|uniref:Uncharacterized protein n=1 Tax=Priestia veravalensis TaxID=1414648 RepID=A0A0V8JJN5_9BACI|nr:MULTISPECIES: hypothetical protein [Priestia]KSU87069.1 hypothetical protein AS180_15245 [Priestia veravalensis]SCC43737.1 hypothetical protein GA0061087_104424 [Priestia flexa]
MKKFLQFYFLFSSLFCFGSVFVLFLVKEYYFAPLFLTLGCLNIFLFKIYIQQTKKVDQAVPTKPKPTT